VIRGVGFDAVWIPRVARLEARYGLRFAHRVLTPKEFVLWERKGGGRTRYLAGRFAAKEAVAKSLGTGFSRGVGLGTIAVLTDGAGRPEVRLALHAAWVAATRGIRRVEISLSDEGEWAFALALALGD
jgi:holo-[acyl-carrier protein] synthase